MTAATFEAKRFFGRYAVLMVEDHQTTVIGGPVSGFAAARIADTLSASATDPEAVRALLELTGRPVLSVRKGRHER
jgi:hypothetical protein